MESVDYNYISEPNGNTNLSIIASDLATINECDFDHIIIHLTRSITFSPTDFYKMSVAVELNYSLNEITKNNFKTKKELMEYANSHINVLINKTPVCSSISAIISGVTSSFGRVPVVTSTQIIEPE